jgi:hypothetical protein
MRAAFWGCIVATLVLAGLGAVAVSLPLMALAVVSAVAAAVASQLTMRGEPEPAAAVDEPELVAADAGIFRVGVALACVAAGGLFAVVFPVVLQVLGGAS